MKVSKVMEYLDHQPIKLIFLGNTMKIKIKIFGQHKEDLNKSELVINSKNNLTINDLIELLKIKEPNFSKFKSYAIAVNLNYENSDYMLKENDEVAIIPPVSGG